MSARMVRDSGSNSAGGGWGEGATQQGLQGEAPPPRSNPLPVKKQVQVYLQLFREKLSQKLHSTIPKSIVGGFI